MVGQTATTATPLVITPVRQLPAPLWPEEVDNKPFRLWCQERFSNWTIHEREADS